MSTYPHDREHRGDEKRILRDCFKLAGDLMSPYLPFGQSSSSYEDTGYPERVAMGIRVFVSSVDNIHLLRDVGDGAIDAIATLGCVREAEKKYKWSSFDQDRYDDWLVLSKAIKAVNPRTWEVIESNIRQYLAKLDLQGFIDANVGVMIS